MFQTDIWFCYKYFRQVGDWFWRKLGFRQYFGFIFSIPIFCKNTKGDGDGCGAGEGVVLRLSFDVQGWGVLAQFRPIRTDRKSGRGCKNWTFFLDVINVWSLNINIVVIEYMLFFKCIV